MSKKICPQCGEKFDPFGRVPPTTLPQFEAATAARIVYCSDACARTAENKKYYARHKDKIIDRVRRNKSK